MTRKTSLALEAQLNPGLAFAVVMGLVAAAGIVRSVRQSRPRG